MKLRFLPVSVLLSLAASGAAAARGESLVAVGKSLTVASPVVGRVVGVAADVDVRAPVSGDVVAWGGRVRLSPGAAIGGSLIAFGAEVTGDLGSVAGKIVTPGSLAELYLSEAKRGPFRPASGRDAATAAGLRLLVLAIWALLSSAVLRLWAGPVARAAQCFEDSPGAAASAGVAGVAFLLLSGVTALSAFPPVSRVASAAVILAAAAALKIFGMTALFLFLGQKISRRYAPRQRPAALAIGLAAAGLVSLVPVAGPLVWSAASVFAVGASVYTRFGASRFRVAVV